MSYNSNARRAFLQKLCCLAASGSVTALIPQLRMMGTALASSNAFTDYKALVCVYLQGGNDAWNVMVPFDAARFGVYTTSRSGTYNANTNSGGLGLVLPTGSAVAQQKIVDGNDSSSSSNQYFLHPSLTAQNTLNLPNASMTDLFSQGHLAFAVNVGTLVKPITMTDYNANSANYPPQLFSHADQTNQWHQANTSETTTTGWGGLSAENLQSQGANLTTDPQLPLSISIAGANRFEVGSMSIPYQLSSNGLTNLTGMCNPTPCASSASASGVRDIALQTLLGDTYSNAFAGQYAQIFQLGRELNNLLSTNLTSTTLSTTFPTTDNSLASQLQTVAKMIKLSKAQSYANRQIYFVQLGSFDLHAGMMSGGTDHATLLANLSSALSAFWTEMVAQGSQDQVTAFTVSEFARTLQSNGSGSDHGWGSLQMMLGGAVKGGKLYSNGGGQISGFPNQSLGGTGSPAPNNFSRGQMIPGIGVEQYAATLAQWMDVASSDLNTIFPNLTNFSSNNLGFI
jgi:uncharacterized protein (DUF1501 family)